MTVALPAETIASAKLQLQSAAAAVASRYPSQVEPLAAPPPGSGLKPVMGNYGFPVLGHILDTIADPLDFARRRYDRYGPVSWAGGIGFRVVQLLGPEALETVWINKDKAFSSTRGWAPVIGPFFHRGIMLLDFEEHRDHRRIMQQAFTRSALEGYLDLMRPGIARTVRGWPTTRRFPLYDGVKKLLLDQAAEVFVGARLGAESDRLSEDFHHTVYGGQAIIRADVPGGAWARGLRARERLERYFAVQIPARRAGAGTDLFSMLCRSRSEDGDRFADEDIVNHMIFLLMAAHDTSAIAISMLAYELGRHRDWQQALRDEAHTEPADELGLDAIDRNYPLLDCAFKETLRMYAPAGTLFRQAIKDTEVAGHYIPRKAQVAINVYASMRLADWWPEPDRFNPDRFTAGADFGAVGRYAFAPFGGGVHKCLGQQFADMNVKAVMHQLLRTFEWTVPKGYHPRMGWGTGPTPADGLPVSMRRLGISGGGGGSRGGGGCVRW
ncbi:cytochrome P450 [Mycolicibacterium diernhoferi]|uniref:Cytochrome P450 n=1 Tax=Mycolicibacterium diernhoferi TaxID=1801 RepID=A0A1Q4H657_9MYCO|nr:cytochrome P450 [Mycolicibacterium diernhoferi]OJZ62922.1 cytochrome P450 [Mycolicibacterium diernhoferi]OPE53265.1 cytochrome P450 [Mycolicibacterium diernhoferi]PEG54742.1 cytochrome P450 [Mycolicibacterium diernhoferi]QYL22962.1 cytochrome P450 [Mycolicibacterium diernhoferi]